jgi:hypothetical protein
MVTTAATGAERAHARARTRSLLVLLSAGLVSAGIAACGSNKSTTPPPTTQTAAAASHNGGAVGGPIAKPLSGRAVGRYLKDFDNDGPGDPARGGRDHDDNEILARFGHPTSPAEARAITAVVERYYAVARAGDGRKACAMMLPSVAEGTALNFGQYGYSYASKAKTCQSAASLIFKHLHHRLSAPVVAMNVIVNGEHAYVLLGSTTMPAGFITLQRWHGAWIMSEPITGDMY